MFFLHLQLDGRSLNRQDGREAVLNAGDFTLCDSTRPYEMQFSGPNHMFVLGIPDVSLRRHLASPECLVAIPMSGSSGLSGLLSDFLRHFWHEYQCGLDDAAANRVSGTILDLVSSAYSVAPQARADRSSLAAAHLVRILNYIEAHLTDRAHSDTDCRRVPDDHNTLLASSVLRGERDRLALHSAAAPRGMRTRTVVSGAARSAQ